MNFKKTWKRANEGFTLVELIVVIAILAILAGIAVPAYSGYIKKANKAADLQLLGAVNTAFAAAALENGDDVNKLTSATAKMPLTGSEGAMTVNVSGIRPAEYKEAFERYFAGNTATFKVIERLDFINGAFAEDKNGSGNMTGAQVQAAKDRVSASNNAGKETELVQTVGNLSNKLAYQIENEGIDLTNYMTDAEKAQYNAFMDSLSLGENPTSTQKANAAVLYAASVMEGVTAEGINQLMNKEENKNKDMMTVLTEEYGTIATSAMMYGVITGYANSDYASTEFKQKYNTTEINGLSDVTALVTAVTTDSAWGQYCNSQEKGLMADMDGYLGAMEIVNGHRGSVDVSQSNAFTNQEIQGILDFIFAN